MDEDRTLSVINNYETNLKTQQKEQLRRNILLASTANPDQYAEATQLSRMNNVPPAIVASDMDTYRNNAKLDDKTAEKIVTKYQTFDEWLQNPDNAKLAHDEVGAMTTVLDTIRSGLAKGLVGQFLGSGIKGIGETAQSASDVLKIEKKSNPALGMMGSFQGMELATTLAGKVLPAFGGGLENAGEILDTPKERQGLHTDIAAGTGQVLGGIGLAIMSGGSTIPAMGMYFGQSAEGQTDGMDKAGVTDPYKRLAVQVAGGAVTAATEKVQLGILMKGGGKLVDILKGTKGMEKVFDSLPKSLQNKYAGVTLGVGGAAVSEAAQETMDNFLQDVIAYAAYNPDVEFFKEWENVATVSGATGAIARSLVMAVSGVKNAGRAVIDDEETKISKDKVLLAAQQAQSLKLNTRDPEKMREVLKAANPENKTATIDAGVLSHFYQSGLDPEEFFNLVPDARTQFENAELSGSDINIPYDEFVYAIANAPTPNSYDFLTDFIKVDPEIDPEMHGWDMKDPDQVNAFIQKVLEQTREQFYARYEQVQQLPLAEEIERRFRDTLMNPDEMGEKVRNAETAAAEAKVMAEYVKTRLSKGGKAAEDTFMQRLSEQNFNVTGAKPKMPKQIGTGDAFYDRLRAKYKAQQAASKKENKKDMFGFAKPKREKATPTPLMNALIEMGGIERGSPIASELEHMGITAKAYPKLYRAKPKYRTGITKQPLRGLDGIPLQEFEQLTGFHGHFKNEEDQNGYVSEKDLLEKLRDETFGNYIRTDEQAAKEQQDEYDAQILDILDQEGVDITTATAKDIDAALKAYKDRYDNEDGQQYYQGEIKTNTEAFKKWFGDSKVVDADGNPLVVYHGTNADFEAFIPSPDGVFGPGAYFTKYDGDASTYGKKILPVYLSIKNPLNMSMGDFRRLRSNGVDIRQWAEARKAEGFDGVVTDDMSVIVAFSPTQIKSVNNRGTFDPNDQRIYYQSAFHGSPHRFDKFTLDHIGTGEGAQAYGWGLYFAGKKEVAEWYKEKLSEENSFYNVLIDGRPIEITDTGLEWNNGDIVLRSNDPEYVVIQELEATGDIDKARKLAASLGQDAIEFIDFITNEHKVTFSKGQLYEVEIPEDDTMLLWDKPLSEQPQKVKEALEKFGITYNKEEGQKFDDALLSALTSDGQVELPKQPSDPSGEDIYSQVMRYVSRNRSKLESNYGDDVWGRSDKIASQILNENGVHGIKYLDGSSRRDGDGTYNYVIFDDKSIEILKTYYQDNHAVTKFLNNGQTVIELFQKANESSLMHEMGHLFLDLDAQIANHPEAPQAFKDEFNATLAWLGIEKYSDAQVKHHEQFARGFEAYLYTGETPNPELKSVFQRMHRWFTNIYKNIKQLGVKVNPEMKAVFDRLLATDEAIEAQKTDKLFNIDQATMEMLNPKQQEEYLKRKEQALQAAKEKLFRKAYRQKLREKTEWWKEESDKVRAEVEADLMKQPVYQAIIKLQDGQDKLNQEQVIKAIDRGNTVNPVGKFEIKYLPRGVVSKEGTLDPSVVADMHGFKSAEQMFNAMKAADPYTKAVQKQTEDRMIARHGDMLNDGTIEKEALAMVMAEDTKAAQVELKALTEKTGILYPSDGDFEKAARLTISKLKVDQAIAPDKYYRAALKAAREYGAALAKKDYEAAAESKRKEIINKHLYAQAKKARDETTKALEHFKKLDKKPPKGNAKAVKIDPDYHEKIWNLLDKYNFNPKISQKKELKLQLAALNQWMQAKEQDEDAVLMMPPELTAADGKTHYRDLTMNEFRAVRDLIDNLETQGRRKRKYIVEGKEEDLAEVTREMVDTAEKFTNPIEHPLTEDKGWLAQMGKLVGGIDAINTKIQQIMVKLDGGDNYGVWTRSVYEPMQRAVINKAIRMRQEGDNLRALMEKYYADDKKSFKDFIAERGGQTITREHLISIAMHFTATEDNRAKLLDFYEKKHGWDEEFIRGVLTQMRAKDWQFVMGVRDLYESFWAETSAIEKRRFGYAPEKLESLPTETFTTVDGTDIDVRGGYARIMYDSNRSFRTMANDLKDAFKELTIGRSAVASTKRGSMKERVASSGQAIRLDLDVIGDHIAEQVGIITMSETVENIAKVLRQNNVQEVMHNNLGKEYKMMVDLWLQDVAAGEGTAAQVNGSALRTIRTNYTIGKLALKPLTALVQMSGIVQTMADPDLGVKYTLHGLKDFLSQDPRTTSEQIRAKSTYMQERKFTLNRDVADALNEYTQSGKTLQNKAAALMLLPMQKVQAMVDMVTWKAAYIKALDDRMDDADAIRYADMSVSRLQGSGLVTDQAAIERGTVNMTVQRQEAVKAGTVLFSYFNAKYNIAKNAKTKYDNKQISAVDLAASITLSFLVEGLVSAFLMGQIDWDKDKDGETTLGETTIGLGQMAFYNAASTIPYGRTVASSMQGFTPQDALTAQLAALGKFIGTAAGDSYNLLTDTKDLEDINWESRAKTVIDAIGVFFAIPSSEAKVLIRAVNKEDPELIDYLVYQK